MSARKADPRGPVAVVMQYQGECGPRVWFPVGFGRTPAARELSSLRSACASAADMAALPFGMAVSVSVQERGRWVPV